MTQKKLRTNVFDKIDTLKELNNDDVISAEQLWMEIEQLSDMLTTVRAQLKSFEENRNNTNLRRNIQMFKDYRNDNDNESLDL